MDSDYSCTLCKRIWNFIWNICSEIHPFCTRTTYCQITTHFGIIFRMEYNSSWSSPNLPNQRLSLPNTQSRFCYCNHENTFHIQWKDQTYQIGLPTNICQQIDRLFKNMKNWIIYLKIHFLQILELNQHNVIQNNAFFI